MNIEQYESTDDIGYFLDNKYTPSLMEYLSHQ